MSNESPHKANRAKVLDALRHAYDDWEDFSYCSFAQIMRRTKLSRAEVRRHCRALARNGLAVFGKGLWTEDGEPAGSGYAISEAGMATFSTRPDRAERELDAMEGR